MDAGNQQTTDSFATIEALVKDALRLATSDNKLDLALLDAPLVQALEPAKPITLLGQLGVIELVRGPGVRAVRPAAKDDARRVLDAARKVLEQITSSMEKQLTRKQLSEAVPDDTVRDTAVWLLKVLGLCTGLMGSGGGIQLSSKTNEEVRQAKAGPAPKQQPEPDTKYESALYPFVANALAALEYRTIVTGVKQRGKGEWGTPDVVGYWVGRSRANILPVLRVATVEVKHELSRHGIAEARAHRRFAHHSFIAVPQPWSELMSDPLVLECIDSGLGLICTKQRESNSFHVHLDAPFWRPDELEVEEFLSQFNADDQSPLIDAVFTAMRTEIYPVLFAAPKG